MAVYFLHLPLSSSRPPFLFSFPLLRLLIQLSLQPSSCALPVATYLSLPLKKKKINVNMRWVCTLNTKGSNVFRFFFVIQATKPNIDRTAQESLNYFFCETVNQRSLSTALNLKNKQTRTPRKKNGIIEVMKSSKEVHQGKWGVIAYVPSTCFQLLS